MVWWGGSPLGRALDEEEEGVFGEALENRVVGVVGIRHFAQAAARIADEVLIAVNLTRAFDEARHIEVFVKRALANGGGAAT